MKHILTIITSWFATASFVFANDNPILVNNQGRSLGGLTDTLVSLMNSLVAVLAAGSLLVFFAGMAKFIYSAGDATEHAKGRNLMLWGIIIFFIMGSLWGIIAFMANSIFTL